MTINAIQSVETGRHYAQLAGRSLIVLLLVASGVVSPVNAEQRKSDSKREWTDKTANYKLTAKLIAYNDGLVVLERGDRTVVTIPMAALSKQDRAFVDRAKSASKNAAGSQNKRPKQILHLKSGLKMPGTVLDFHEHDVMVQNRFGKLYVNNRQFDKLPGIYRKVIPLIAQHFTQEEISDEKSLKSWVRAQKGKPRAFKCRGLLVELSDGDLYCIPFFLFAEETVKALRPGWERWLEAREDIKRRERESFLLRAQARAFEQEKRRLRNIQQLQLFLQGYDAGLFHLWEVELLPPNGSYGMEFRVVVPAVTSEDATRAALRRHPTYQVGAMRIIRRRN